MATIRSLQERCRKFVAERDWDQFHTPKNLAEAISIEANELLENFLWHDNHESEVIREDSELTAQVAEELADVVIYSMGLAIQLDIDLAEAVERKLEENERRFDEETSSEITEELRRWQRD